MHWESSIKRSTLEVKRPKNVQKIGSFDSEGSKISSLKTFWNPRTFGFAEKLIKVENGAS